MAILYGIPHHKSSSRAAAVMWIVPPPEAAARAAVTDTAIERPIPALRTRCDGTDVDAPADAAADVDVAPADTELVLAA